MKTWREKDLLLFFFIIFSAFLLFTSIISALKHFAFYTNAYDTGIQAGVARNAAINGSFYDTVMDINYLGDHFSPSLFLIGLLYYVWDSPAVALISQNIFIFIGVLIGFIIAKKTLELHKAILISLLLLFNYYLTQANTYEFHIETTLGIPLLFTLIFLLEKEKKKFDIILVIIISLLSATVKEDIPLVVAFLGLWALIFRPQKRLEGFTMAIIGFVSFFIISKYLIPTFSNGEYTHIGRYSNLGQTPEEIVKTLLTRPDIIIYNLITPLSKIKHLLLLLMSFAFLPLLAPLTLLSGFAPIFYNSISNYQPQWSFGFHYSYSVIPFLFLSSIYGIKNIEKILEKIRDLKILNKYYPTIRILPYSWIILILFISIIISTSKYIGDFSKVGYYYQFEKEVKSRIPRNSKILAASNLQPHFIGYDYAGFLGVNEIWKTNKVEYIITWKTEIPWNFNETWHNINYYELINSLRKSWNVIYEDEKIIAFKKKS